MKKKLKLTPSDYHGSFGPLSRNELSKLFGGTGSGDDGSGSGDDGSGSGIVKKSDKPYHSGVYNSSSGCDGTVVCITSC